MPVVSPTPAAVPLSSPDGLEELSLGDDPLSLPASAPQSNKAAPTVSASIDDEFEALFAPSSPLKTVSPAASKHVFGIVEEGDDVAHTESAAAAASDNDELESL